MIRRTSSPEKRAEKAIAEWIPPRERGLSMAVFSNGNIMGAVVGSCLSAVSMASGQATYPPGGTEGSEVAR